MATAESTDLGLKARFGPEKRILRASSKCAQMILDERTKIQAIINAAEKTSELPDEKKASALNKKYELLGRGGDGIIVKTPAKNGLDLALKVYFDSCPIGGLKYFRGLLKAKQENHYETLTPYLATRKYILTDLIPPYPDFDTFVSQHPELEREVTEALIYIQFASNLGDAGITTDISMRREEIEAFLDKRMSVHRDEDAVKGVHVARYNPEAKSLREKYRFFMYDML